VITQWCRNWLWAGRSGFDSRRGWEFLSSPPRLDRLWNPPILVSSGYRRSSGRGVKLTIHLLLVPMSKIRGFIPPSPLRLHGVMLSYAQEQLYIAFMHCNRLILGSVIDTFSSLESNGKTFFECWIWKYVIWSGRCLFWGTIPTYICRDWVKQADPQSGELETLPNTMFHIF
jgi:hypothetical protein